MLKNKIKKITYKLLIKKTEAILGDPSEVGLISQTCNPWNPRHKLNHEAQIQTNLMLNDEIR